MSGSSSERPPLRVLIVRPVGIHEIELRVVPFDDMAYYAAVGWMLVATDPADEAFVAAWALLHGRP